LNGRVLEVMRRIALGDSMKHIAAELHPQRFQRSCAARSTSCGSGTTASTRPGTCSAR
jgi:hypothetical protein